MADTNSSKYEHTAPPDDLSKKPIPDGIERKPLLPQIVENTLTTQKDLLIEAILQLPPEQAKEMLEELSRRVGSAIDKVNTTLSTPETSEALKERLQTLIEAYRKVMPKERLRTGDFEKLAFEKKRELWNAMRQLATLVLEHQELLRPEFRKDYEEELKRPTTRSPGLAEWNRFAKADDLPGYEYHREYPNILYDAEALCRFAMDPLNTPEEDRIVPHIKESVGRLKRSMRSQLRTVQPNGVRNISERYKGSQARVADEMTPLREKFAKLTEKLPASSVYDNVKLPDLPATVDIDLLTHYTADLEEALEAKDVLAVLIRKVKESRVRLVGRLQGEPDQNAILEWVRKNPGQRIYIPLSGRDPINRIADEALIKQVWHLASDAKASELISGVTWSDLTGLGVLIYRLKQELGKYEVVKKEYDALPLVVDLQGYHYKADRGIVGQFDVQTDEKDGRDKIQAKFDDFASGLEKLEKNPLWWRKIFDRQDPLAVDSMNKMIFIGLTIQKDDITSRSIQSRDGYSREEWWRDTQPPEGDGQFKYRDIKAIGFLVGRKIAMKSRSYVPPKFADNFLKSITSMDKLETSEEEVYSLAESIFDTWNKANPPRTDTVSE